MASPPEITCRNLSGTFVMNKSLTDDFDSMLALQGLSWFTRKAISLATVILTIKEYIKDDTLHIDITSVASGLSTTQEDRTLNWTDALHKDRIFGEVKGRSRIFKSENFEMQGGGPEQDRVFLLAEKLKDGETDSRFLDDEHVQSWAVSQGYGWTAEQVWGFEAINNTRYYTRRVVVKKDDKVERARLVYDYKGPVKEEVIRDDSEDLAYGD